MTANSSKQKQIAVDRRASESKQGIANASKGQQGPARARKGKEVQGSKQEQARESKEQAKTAQTHQQTASRNSSKHKSSSFGPLGAILAPFWS